MSFNSVSQVAMAAQDAALFDVYFSHSACIPAIPHFTNSLCGKTLQSDLPQRTYTTNIVKYNKQKFAE